MENINVMEWLDALWIPVFILLLHKNQKIWAAGFVICNMVMMRMMGELIVWIGYPHGILNVLHADMLIRGLITSCVVYLLYLVIALYSPKSDGPMFMGMSLTLFFAASVLYAIVMVL